MKKIAIIFLFLTANMLLLQACNTQEGKPEGRLASALQSVEKTAKDTLYIAERVGDDVLLRVDQQQLLNDWSVFLSEESSEIYLKTLQIISRDEKQFLVAAGTRSGTSTRATIRLIEMRDEPLFLLTGVTVVCETTDCPDEMLGCFPIDVSCNPCSNSGKCKKTVSTSASTIFPSL